ncbi:two component transcriptional regulator, winged helix family [Dyella sp. OK004]|uniref:response regulator transcription factor n=1 Tax=Dyella sp. OK004 TaxID=1855292 RepID=UPI0008E3C2F1|nr:response regulator transcription factor [Dyella sp. OK004]SFS14549.1 two component transcriptional regulator, winged helix family [Dyella sp. OK004]
MEKIVVGTNASSPRTWRVIVLEDDEVLREHILIPGLIDYGFAVTGVRTSADLYRHMLSNQYDIAVLDIGLPGEDGITVAQHLRQLSSMGIVMLTGNHERSDHIRSLVAGADTYLSKPVDIEVLAASLHSLARRLRTPIAACSEEKAAYDSVPSRAEWRLETNDWCLATPRNATIALSGSERCALQLLMAAKGAAVSREELIATLCNDVYDFDPHRLEMLVYRLRRKAREQSESLPLVTVRGVGYAFIVDQNDANDALISVSS